MLSGTDWKWQNVFGYLKSLIVLNKLLGLAPFRMHEASDGGRLVEMKRSRLQMIYSVSLCLFVVTTLIFKISFMDQIGSTPAMVYTLLGVLVAAITVTSVALNSTINLRKFNDILHMFIRVDEIMKVDGHCPSRVSRLFIKIQLGVTLITLLSFLIIFVADSTGLLSKFISFGLYVSLCVTLGEIITFIDLVLLVYIRYGILNASLKSLNIHSKNYRNRLLSSSYLREEILFLVTTKFRNSVEERCDRVRALREVHLVLSDISRTVLSTHQFPMLLFLTYFFFSCMWYVFFSLGSTCRAVDPSRVFMPALLTAVQGVVALAAVISCHLAASASGESSELIQHLLLEEPQTSQVLEQLRAFDAQVRGCRVSFPLCGGVLCLDMRLLSDFAASFTTYTVVLFSFKTPDC